MTACSDPRSMTMVAVSVTFDESGVLPKLVDDDDPLRARFDAAMRRGDEDLAWRVAAALSMRDVANESERALYHVSRPASPPAPARGIAFADWATLFSPSEDAVVGETFACIAPALLELRARAMAKSGQLPALDFAHCHAPRTSVVPMVRAFGAACEALSLAVPDIYVVTTPDVGLEILPSPPSVLVGGAIASAQDPRELVFHAARQLVYLLPEHVACSAVPHRSTLKELFVAALLAGEPSLPLAASDAARHTARELRALLDADAVQSLRDVIRKFIARGGCADVYGWASAVEATACRAGLLACGDLETVIESVSRRPGAEPLIEELIEFWLSGAFGELRARMGTALERCFTSDDDEATVAR